MCVWAQSLTHVWLFCGPLDCSLPGSSAHVIFQARILEWVAISYSLDLFWYVTRIGQMAYSERLVAVWDLKPISEFLILSYIRASLWLSSKESACSAGDMSSIPGSGGCPGEGNDNPLQCFCLENPMDRGPWQATVHRVAQSQTLLGD